MSEAVITVDNLTKRYTLGHKSSKEDGLRHLIEAALRNPLKWFKRQRNRRKAEREEFYAIKNLSFEVNRGDVLGVIGRNGAGKSTLLKVLSRITEPTSGKITIDGRIASLLEVGTGFHPELTGRENIYLNGAILGMRRNEIKNKFDQIVDFSEIEKFLDTPVKRYSSGMYVRLAFAVAAHLEPEILIVDEVLAVGDSQFQKKCLGKMGEISQREGRTVLFVSHNMGAVSNLCTKGLLLQNGQRIFHGASTEAVDAYLATSHNATGQVLWDEGKRPGTNKLRLRSVRVVADSGHASAISIDSPIHFDVEFDTLVPHATWNISLHIVHPSAGEILSTVNFPSASLGHDPWANRKYPQGRFRSRCTLPANFLNEGTYLLNVAIMSSTRDVEVFVREAIQFTAQDTGGMRKEFTGHWIGLVRPRLHWETTQMEKNQ